MTSATLVTLPQGRYVLELQEQLRDFGADPPGRLVVCCSEPEPGGVPGWQRAVGPAYTLRSPAASTEEAGIREAVHFAVHRLGVKEVVLVVHSRCSHLLPEPDAAERDRERGLPFMERLQAGRARARRQLAAARQRVRRTVRALAADPVLDGVLGVGMVHLVESGVMLAYDPDRDDFEPLL